MIEPLGHAAGPPASSLLTEQLGKRAPLYCEPAGNHRSNPVMIGARARASPLQPKVVVSFTPPGFSGAGAREVVEDARATAVPIARVLAVTPAAATFRITS